MFSVQFLELVARLASYSSKVNTKVTRAPMDLRVHPVIIRVEQRYKFMWDNLNPTAVFWCGHELIHSGLFVKELTIKPLKVPHILEEIMCQRTVSNEKHTRVESLEISSYEQKFIRFNHTYEIIEFTFLIGDEYVTVEPYDPVPILEMFLDQWNFRPLEFAFHVVKRKLLGDSRVLVSFGVTHLTHRTQNHRSLVFFAYC
jgi:hypothetical protein